VWAGPSLPRLDNLGVAPPVMGVALLVTLATAGICAVAPVLHASGTPAAGLSAGGRAVTGVTRQRRVARAFVMLQIAAALVLLVMTAMTVRSFLTLLRTDPGFRPDGAISVQLSLPPARYQTREAIVAFADRLEARFADHPGVTGVGAVSLLPLGGLLATQDFHVAGRPIPAADAVPQAHFRIATPGYFGASGIDLRDGRTFDDRDRETGQPVAIINRTLAARMWPDGGAIGASVVLSNETAPRTIVGVVGDVKQFALDTPATGDLYVPLHQMPKDYVGQLSARMYWVVRAEGPPAEEADVVERDIRSLDADVAASGLRRLDQALSVSLAPRRFNAELVGLFGQAGLLLAALGVYAVTAHAVGRRTREIGVRIALGARPGDVLRLVMVSELRPVALGVIVGAIGAWIVAHGMARVLFAMDAADIWAIVASGASLALVAGVACYLPARRVLAADPAAALRAP
jgi:putative ABC transport system permease protein